MSTGNSLVVDINVRHTSVIYNVTISIAAIFVGLEVFHLSQTQAKNCTDRYKLLLLREVRWRRSQVCHFPWASMGDAARQSRGHLHVNCRTGGCLKSVLYVVINTASKRDLESERVDYFRRQLEPINSIKYWMRKIDPGYIQTPGNNEVKGFWPGMDCWEHLYPPSRHVTLLSMHRLETFKKDEIEVLVGGEARENSVWHVSGHVPPAPALFNARDIHVHFCSGTWTTLGFQLYFSYHLPLHQPVRMNNSLWNCSVPEWHEFQRHFLCNVDKECEGGEDEARCFYTGHCGQGRLTLDNRCYSYMAPSRPISWLEANVACRDQGGLMASLNTARETEAVIQFLVSRRVMTWMFVGIQPAHSALPVMYAQSWQWADGTISWYTRIWGWRANVCGYSQTRALEKVCALKDCKSPFRRHFMCEFPNPISPRRGDKKETISVASTSKALFPLPYVQCPHGHLTHLFMACDLWSSCWASCHGNEKCETSGIPSRASCHAPVTSLPASFVCNSGSQRLPYTMVCDHRQHCKDGSDEIFCVFPPCVGTAKCSMSYQCIPVGALCDSIPHCFVVSEEADCGFPDYIFHFHPPPPPAVVNYDPIPTSYELFRYDYVTERKSRRNSASLCPPTHFQCPVNGYCMPTYMRCNGVMDCPGREDEAGCEDFACPGYYRCRGSQICLHVTFVCDGVPHCPERDDELYCHFPPCPHNCTCHGLSYTCNGIFSAVHHTELRYLNAEGSGLDAVCLSDFIMLVHLSLADCGVRAVENVSFPNLRSLDLRDNLITAISLKHLRAVRNLQVLNISGNPLTDVFPIQNNGTSALQYLEVIDTSGARVEKIDFSQFTAFPNLRILNLSHSTVSTLFRSNKRSLKNIQVLDLHRSQVTQFQRDLMSYLSSLETVFCDNYKLCCPFGLPEKFNPKNCHAPLDPVSSCQSLLSSFFLRVLLAVCCPFALLGNLVSVVVHFVGVRKNGSTAGVFLTHLAIADFVMAVWVTVVVVADGLYRGRYALVDTAWRNSAACSVLGFFFLLSSQTSVIVVFLLSFDELISLFFCAGKSLFNPLSGQIVCVIVWMAGVTLSALPLLLTHWEVFGSTAVCIPLLVTAENLVRAPAATFVSAVVVFGFLLMFIAGVSQAAFYNTIHSAADSGFRSSSPDTTSNKFSEAMHARRAFPLCTLNVTCWLLLSVLAALAWRGSPLPEALHVHVGIVALPVTSALRPVVHAIGNNQEQRRRKRTIMLMARIAAQRRHQRLKERNMTEGVE